MHLMEKNVTTFIGCDKEYKKSDAVIFGVPFDGTTSYRPGARFAPAAVRGESYGIETYSPYQDRDLEDINVFDGGDLALPFGNTEKVLEITREFTEKILGDGKLPVMIGGEHLVTLGAFYAAHSRYEDVRVVHFDAHTDLRDEYLGEKLSHACVIRRIHDVIGDGRIYQFGIRSGERADFEFAAKHTYLRKFDFGGIGGLYEKIGDAPVYLTIDQDVLDPSEFCGTGTPEAGGVSFGALLDALLGISKLNVVAADIVELSPPYDSSGVSVALSCKLLREVLLCFVR